MVPKILVTLFVSRHVVIDEVDRMLDMGFSQLVEDILAESYRSGNTVVIFMIY